MGVILFMSKHVEELVDRKCREIVDRKNIHEVGRVAGIKNYIIEVEGLDGAAYFEKIVIDGKAEGYVSTIGRNRIYVALIRKTEEIYIGDAVHATGVEFKGVFSPDSIGHIVDMFGVDRMNDQKFDNTIELAIETPPIPIMDRGNVKRPMQTGVTGIDMIYPVGKGQRQLIIGDKRTGKTQLCLDAIVNQKGRDMICIYIAIGKTKKEIKNVFYELLKRGAMEYTIIISAFNDEFPPVIKTTPFMGLAVAEKYMLEGKDVLVCIDDLKRHADVCREIGLLTGTVPGRDAYPSDIFYTHARLLERGCQHKDGGSVTILPICETKGGDINDYISSNIISITDGQIVLSTKNFEKGNKPAIEYGLSVSRLGGAVQTREMKAVGAVVRRELLAYLEKCDVYELANEDEMSPELLKSMRNGKAIRNKLRQYKFSPIPPEEMQHMFDGLVDLG